MPVTIPQVILVIFVIAFGTMVVFFPDRFAVFGGRWRTNGVTPAEARRTGVIFLVVGLIGVVLLLVSPLMTPAS